MKYKVTMQEENLKEEGILRVQNLKVGFNSILPSSVNYVDSHGILPIFGLRWGRGVLTKSPQGYDCIIGMYSSSHAKLKQSMNNDEQTAGTIYWGFDSNTKTLYLEYGSDRTFDFNNGKVLNAIIEALKYSNTPMRNMKI